MTKLFLVFLMTISTAFAGETISFFSDFNVSPCAYSPEEGESCAITVNIPVPDDRLRTVYLHSVGNNEKRGELLLTKETEAGVFEGRITIQKIGGVYTFYPTIIDPDGDVYHIEAFSITRISHMSSITYDGPVWYTGANTYLVPNLALWVQ